MARGTRAASGLRVLALVACALVALSLPATAIADDTDIAISEYQFSPARITIDEGDTVTWTNRGDRAHTVTADDGSFDSGALARGDVFGHVFDTPGTFTYRCTINPTQVRGTVVVIAVTATPSPSGSQRPAPPPGTLPPDFRTRAPAFTAEPIATSTEAPVPEPTTREPDSTATQASSSEVLLLGIAGALALVVAVVALARRRRGL